MSIFVFGSNLTGRHGKGAAWVAYKRHGAIYGQGIGLQGKSYGIPTKDERIRTLPLHIINEFVNAFIWFTQENLDLKFYVTRIGCGLAGYSPSDIAPMFAPCIELPNVQLNRDFKNVLKPSAKSGTLLWNI
jgi:hypothetical protein